ncbi:flagellar hook-length control protein FliK [Campylobacter jejuni]|uniref:Flagellar hook-length control protein n=1 Tax=Campylobacter jejuni subsp. jejuni serotype O:2 (strain ATCC 700819 / NCTC 11168) TaxID=192222 RepID=Q0PC85_CAMJE|nr:flagellar hook-length control protein FliK [Campylobacter jejuni]YP_002343512.1 flagellar hook-length control protein [Campylobacter jejuni subsp. jejuni NCTC 11168 = ATCC 700819]ASE88730.1 flagellar hook-length control protein FliK [Campylobacter jejuni]ASN47548.1 flagellar hook-length control protein FliK [Campylobacter jejuni]ASQ31368.1 flagellar hook-length control protein FliK [Campylobacter jejuni]EAH6017164.1 flagellar hook-length control protein FliK [Campylobacter jejuni]EAH662308
MMSNLAPQNDVLNLTPSKTSTTSSSFSKTSKNKEHESSDSKNSTQDDTESFLNSLLNSINETNEFLPDHMKISQKEVVNEAMSRLQKGAFDESDKISIFESASFMQILSLLDKLKTDTADVKLANLSTQLSSLIKTEANFNALKGASNLSELLDIAKDLGLNVKNIKVDRLLDLKATFPNLDKADFFKGAVDNVFKEIINNKISNVSKNLNHNLENTTHTTSTHSMQKTNSKDSGSLLSQTLKNLDSILSSKESKHEKNDKVKSKIEEDTTDAKNTLKNIKNDEFAKNLTEELNIKDKKNQDNLNKESKDLNKDFNKELNKNQEKNNLNQENIQDQNKNLKNNDQNLNLDKNLNKEIVKDTQKLVSNLTQKDFNLNKEPKNNNKENKDIKQNFFDQKLNFENLNKTQVVQNKENNANFNNNNTNNKETFTQEQTKTHSENVDKNSLDELNSLVKDLNKVTQNNARNITPKETLQYFSQDLKEAVDQYKAPITKLSITLNPNNLGEVEVTLIQRGNNLHINFNSNANAMNLFIQNQAEFKNSLVNMGFTGLEMNFSDQGKREQNQNQGKNRSGYGFKDALDGKNESEKVNLELVLAKYF